MAQLFLLDTGKSDETRMRSGEAEEDGVTFFSLVERILRKLFSFWVCVWSCIKILCWVHIFPFLIIWVKFHCVYMPHARKWMGKCEEQKEAGEVVGKEKTKIIFVWKMS